MAYFVVGVRFEQTSRHRHIPTSAGEFLVLMMVILFTIGMVHVYCDKVSVERNILFYGVGVIALALGFSGFVIPFDITWILITVCVAMILYLCYGFERACHALLFILPCLPWVPWLSFIRLITC